MLAAPKATTDWVCASYKVSDCSDAVAVVPQGRVCLVLWRLWKSSENVSALFRLFNVSDRQTIKNYLSK